MAARPAWRGQIKLALVSIPVEIYPATKSGAAIAFHQIHEPTGKRIKYEKVVPGIGPVNTDDIVKGFEVSKGEYVLLEPEEIESVEVERQPLWNNLKHEHGPFDIVGDVHGCRDELAALLGQLGYRADAAESAGSVLRHPQGRKVVFLGDLVDRGPDTPEANAAHRGGGVILEGAPGAPAPPPQPTPPAR